MTTEFVPADPEMTARAVLERLQASVRLLKEEYVQSLYVTAPNGKLVGGLTLKTLISSPADIKVKDIMSPVALIRIPARMDQEDAAEVFSRYKLISAPVVDDEIRLVGVLTVDDILDVVQDEATEDMAKLAGTKAEDLETGSFMRVTVLRMPWLLASYFGGILASFVIGHYQELLGRVLALATFIPVIAGMGGNVGTQSSTIVVRGLATGRIQLDRIWKVIRREFAVGLTLGLTYGCFLSAVAVARHGTAYSWRLPVVVGVGILTSMTVAAVMGTMTPVLFKKLKIDPAAVSAPFVSTATDLASIGVYLLLASKLLF
ncbi:MAG: magnesium transporter [Elusimicrobia bacterium RIFCSPHIGHO2_01_FULL_64_10]|nr:MAG: magnesium transporter [Elusimicrobia bacterium RIFCSPHIGHO2_01_FULL_64_10]